MSGDETQLGHFVWSTLRADDEKLICERSVSPFGAASLGTAMANSLNSVLAYRQFVKIWSASWR